MKFYLYEEQSGGCDYTIGCGRRLTPIAGVADAEGAAKAVLGRLDLDGDYAIRRAAVLCVADELEIDLDALRREREAGKARGAAEEREAAERAEFERLSAKYGRAT